MIRGSIKVGNKWEHYVMSKEEYLEVVEHTWKGKVFTIRQTFPDHPATGFKELKMVKRKGIYEIMITKGYIHNTKITTTNSTTLVMDSDHIIVHNYLVANKEVLGGE